MSLELTKPSGETRVDDVRALRFRVRDVDLTGTTYQDDQSTTTISAGDVGLSRILMCIPAGVLAAADLATANGIGVTVSDDQQSVALSLYENGASGAALAEKTDNEAVPTGASVRCLFIGS